MLFILTLALVNVAVSEFCKRVGSVPGCKGVHLGKISSLILFSSGEILIISAIITYLLETASNAE